MFWFCPQASHILVQISITFNTARYTTISPEPLLASVGVLSQPITSKIMTTVFALITLLARGLVPLNWKHLLPPSKKLLLSIKLEKLRPSLIGSLKSFENTWKPLLNHLESLTSLPGCDGWTAQFMWLLMNFYNYIYCTFIWLYVECLFVSVVFGLVQKMGEKLWNGSHVVMLCHSVRFSKIVHRFLIWFLRLFLANTEKTQTVDPLQIKWLQR